MWLSDPRYNPINDVDIDKVNDIKKSIIKNGWEGIIFTTGDYLLTGSHRIEALKALANDDIEISFEIIDLYEEFEAYCERNEITYYEFTFDEIDDMDETAIREFLKR